MKFRHQPALASVFLFLSLASAAAETSGPGGLGVIVEEVGQGSALERAGLRPGDLVLSWAREGDTGEIRTVFDWMQVKAEQAPRGTVRLGGERGGAAVSFAVARGDWDARMRPRITADLLPAYTEGRQRIAAGDVEGGVALWDRLADLKPWILLQAAEDWSNAGEPEKARSALQAALEESADPRVRVAALSALGQSYQDASDTVHAEASYRSALEIANAGNAGDTGDTARGESLQTAAMTSRLGSVLRQQNRMPEATQAITAAMEMRERLAPGSLDVADSLSQLAGLAWTKGDVPTFYALARRALKVQEQWAPDSLATATILNNVGISAFERGFFEEGREALQRALAIQERRAPGSAQLAMTLANLGAAARQTGDTDVATELLQ